MILACCRIAVGAVVVVAVAVVVVAYAVAVVDIEGQQLADAVQS